MKFIKYIMEKQKQKLSINYKPDQSFHGFKNNSEKLCEEKQLFPGIENAMLGKRNRLHYKAKNLEKLVQKYKVNRLVNNFIQKLRLNSTYRTPYEQQESVDLQNEEKNSIFENFKSKIKQCKQKNGFEMGNLGLILWSVINIIQISIMVFVFCIMMAFPETQDFPIFMYFRTVSIALYVIDMYLNFTVKRYENGKYLQGIGQIGQFYLKHGFVIDLLCILIFPIDILVTTKTNITIVISFAALIKLMNNITKFQKFEYLIINSSGKEHYYGLIKVFITNFAIGHFLSILLNLMAYINTEDNWQVKLQIANAEWYIKYIWGYYWGTNIMLTVGFGDICAQNQYEAILLVFIQTFSCITLAYNINFVGALIGSIRESDEEKKKKLKIFHRMCKQNFINNQMESKVACHIQQQYRIKQSFQYDAHDEFLKSLPKNLQIQFRKQANKTLFDNIGFLNNLSKKSLLKLAEVISRRICHPQEIIIGKGCISHFTILQKGSLSFTCRIRSKIDGTQIESIQIKQNEKPKIISLHFIKNKTVNYVVKSKSYSILYYLSREQVMESLKNSQMDYQMFSQLKDKDESSLQESNLYLCQVCKDIYHNRFECSKLHFIPLKRKVILKHIHNVNKIKQLRQKAFERNKNIIKPYSCQYTLRDEQKKFIQQNFDEEHYMQFQNLLNFYNNLNFDATQTQQEYKSQVRRVEFLNRTQHGTRKLSLLDDKALLKLQQMLENKNNKLIFNVWEFQIDQAENFNFYFREGNPEQLKKAKKNKKNKGLFY